MACILEADSFGCRFAGLYNRMGVFPIGGGRGNNGGGGWIRTIELIEVRFPAGGRLAYGETV